MQSGIHTWQASRLLLCWLSEVQIMSWVILRPRGWYAAAQNAFVVTFNVVYCSICGRSWAPCDQENSKAANTSVSTLFMFAFINSETLNKA